MLPPQGPITPLDGSIRQQVANFRPHPGPIGQQPPPLGQAPGQAHPMQQAMLNALGGR